MSELKECPFYREIPRDEIERLKNLVETAYREGWIHGWNSDCIASEVKDSEDYCYNMSNTKQDIDNKVDIY